MSQTGRSFGGAVVESSLSALGYDLTHSAVALVETARPRWRAFDVVLAQNAWNFLSRREFERRAARYPASMRRRMVARRVLSRAVVARSSRVVCLTEYMATLVREQYGGEIVVSPVTVPLDFAGGAVEAFSHDPDSGHTRVLIPGTVTWYKRPELAVDWVLDNMDVKPGLRLLFAGRSDNSGAADGVLAKAARCGIRAEIKVLSRNGMADAMRRADVVVLPSELESLGLALAEALMSSKRVVASPIAPHREVARRVGADPEWLGAGSVSASRLPLVMDAGEVAGQWEALGRTLGLVKSAGAKDGVRS